MREITVTVKLEDCEAIIYELFLEELSGRINKVTKASLNEAKRRHATIKRRKAIEHQKPFDIIDTTFVVKE